MDIGVISAMITKKPIWVNTRPEVQQRVSIKIQSRQINSSAKALPRPKRRDSVGQRRAEAQQLIKSPLWLHFLKQSKAICFKLSFK